jgi:hypothetical protein
MPSRYFGPPMTLNDMRAIGVRAIAASCYCGHSARVDVSGLSGAIEVPSLRARLRCVICGARPADVRPDWLQYRAHGMGRQ